MQYSTSHPLEHVELKALYKVAFSVYRLPGTRYQVYTLLLRVLLYYYYVLSYKSYRKYSHLWVRGLTVCLALLPWQRDIRRHGCMLPVNLLFGAGFALQGPAGLNSQHSATYYDNLRQEKKYSLKYCGKIIRSVAILSVCAVGLFICVFSNSGEVLKKNAFKQKMQLPQCSTLTD